MYFIKLFNFSVKFYLNLKLFLQEADNDVDTDDEQLDLAKEHVQDVLKNAIKNFNVRDLSRGIISNQSLSFLKIKLFPYSKINVSL